MHESRFSFTTELSKKYKQSLLFLLVINEPTSWPFARREVETDYLMSSV